MSLSIHFLPLRPLIPVAMLLTCMTLTGCSSLLGSRQRGPLDDLDLDGLKAAGYSVDSHGVSAPIPVKDDGRPSIVLEVNDGKKHLEKIPLPAEKSTFVGDIIREAQLTDRLGRVDVTILRPAGPGLPPVRMDVDFDSRGKNVMEGQNYSLRPGDHLIVRKNTEGFLDRFMAQVAPWTKSNLR